VLRSLFDRIAYYIIYFSSKLSGSLSGRAYFVKRGQLLIKAAIDEALNTFSSSCVVHKERAL